MNVSDDMHRLTRALRMALQGMGVLWLILGVLIASGIVSIGIESTLTRFVIGVLLACDGGAFALAGWWYRPRAKAAAMSAVALVALNLVLTVTDDLGTADLVALVVFGALLTGLLVDISDRKRSVSRSKRLG